MPPFFVSLLGVVACASLTHIRLPFPGRGVCLRATQPHAQGGAYTAFRRGIYCVSAESMPIYAQGGAEVSAGPEGKGGVKGSKGSKGSKKAEQSAGDEGAVMLPRRVMVTPLRALPYTGVEEVSNRVIRRCASPCCAVLCAGGRCVPRVGSIQARTVLHSRRVRRDCLR